MAEIQPFRALRYNPERVTLGQALTQPYDKISPEMQERYYAASPFNLIAIEKGKAFPGDLPENNVYTRAAQKSSEWIAEKVLVQDELLGIYVYSQEYVVPGTHTRRTRMGFIAAGRLEDYDAKVVFRHERTLTAPKADRIELLRRTHLQTGQLFMLYDDPKRKIDTWLEGFTRKSAPSELVDEYGVAHRLWPVTDPAPIERIQNEMSGKSLVIADGHHRYETALNFRNEMRAQMKGSGPRASWEFAMMTFVNARSPGLTILPTHRLVHGLADFDFLKFREKVARDFDWYSYPFATEEERAPAYSDFRKDLEKQKHGRRAIGVFAGGGAFYLFAMRRGAELEELLPDVSEAQRRLDLVLLHRLILEKGLGITTEAVAGEKNLTYERDMNAAIGSVDHGRAQIAFLLNPVRIEQVMEIALAGEVLPQKSTDFYPKLLSGIAIYSTEGTLAVGV
jgi:uncharacterized protein (DUF1015 family)